MRTKWLQSLALEGIHSFGATRKKQLILDCASYNSRKLIFLLFNLLLSLCLSHCVQENELVKALLQLQAWSEDPETGRITRGLPWCIFSCTWNSMYLTNNTSCWRILVHLFCALPEELPKSPVGFPINICIFVQSSVFVKHLDFHQMHFHDGLC
jgi:hypothetical protein